ncbi:MAG: alpha/beta hydrolase, partial [Candidatus Heimdallarchaeota archaeon]
SHPEVVQGLVLISTAFGGPKSRAVQPSNKILAAMFATPTETISLQEATAIRRSTAWSESFLKENERLVKQMDKWISENPQPDYARGRQAEAGLSFDSEEFAGKITAPTLILHGEKDQIVIPENAEMLLNTIPNSRLIFFRNSPHRILVERHNEVNNIILDFLTEVETGSYNPEPKKIYI